MITNLRLDLTDDQRQALYTILGGPGKGLATRKQIEDWSIKTLLGKIANPNGNGKIELRNTVCPKCSKPIAIPMPVAVDRKRDDKLAAASDKAKAAANDLVAVMKALAEALS